MLSEAKAASEKFAADGDVDLAWERLWNIEPILFHKELVDLCDDAVRETGAEAGSNAIGAVARRRQSRARPRSDGDDVRAKFAPH